MKKLSIIMVLVTLFLNLGCSKKVNRSSVATTEKPPKMLKFQRCITDAKTLSQLDAKYGKNTQELYSLVNNAKFYASIADDSSSNVSSTITPFFDYKLNEICNEISVLLIREFQAQTFNNKNEKL
ncbi:TPA: hypothetical protein LVN30_005574 [Klebsiella oxytoca]|nr:hypothetical protein [Klebsiella oxytoca]